MPVSFQNRCDSNIFSKNTYLCNKYIPDYSDNDSDDSTCCFNNDSDDDEIISHIHNKFTFNNTNPNPSSLFYKNHAPIFVGDVCFWQTSIDSKIKVEIKSISNCSNPSIGIISVDDEIQNIIQIEDYVDTLTLIHRRETKPTIILENGETLKEETHLIETHSIETHLIEPHSIETHSKPHKSNIIDKDFSDFKFNLRFRDLINKIEEITNKTLQNWLELDESLQSNYKFLEKYDKNTLNLLDSKMGRCSQS